MDYAIVFDNFGQGEEAIVVPCSECNEKYKPDQTRPYSAYEALTKFYGESIEHVVSNYLVLEIESLREREEFKNAQAIRLLSYHLKTTRSKLQQPLDRTVVDFIVDCRVELEEEKTKEGTIRKHRTSLWLKIRYILDMRPCEKKCLGPLIFPYDEKEDPWLDQYDIPTNEYLLPIIRAEDYETIAHRMIEAYYPEYKVSLPDGLGPIICGDDLARRMGLKVYDVRFADSSTLGQIYFAPGNVNLIDNSGKVYSQPVKPATILISIDYCQFNIALRNSTIVHECGHMYLDRAFFFLQMMTGRQYSSYTSKKKKLLKRRDYKKNSPIDWMELQCDKLPAYLLMESKDTVNFVEGELQKYNGVRSPSNVYSIVNALADRNHVSFSMAKIRMTELGFPEAEGVRCYVDQKRVPDHGCAGRWPEGITYTISAYDAAELMQTDSSFERKVGSGEYCYVEGHFCLNDRQYIRHTRAGVAYLTPYARTHINECCVAFHAYGRYKNSSYQSGQAFRNKTEPVTDKYRPGYELAAEPGTPQYSTENTVFADDSFLWGELLYHLKPTFKEAVEQIRKLKGITQEALALELGVDRAAYSNYLNEESPSMEHVIGICVALKLPYYISAQLVTASGNSFQMKESHHLYREFLLQAESLSVSRCEDILSERHMKPLFKGESFRDRTA